MELIVLTGLPGSGKTTYRQRLPAHELFCPDEYLLTGDGTYSWTPERSAKAWASAYQKLGRWLRSDGPLLGVFDATLVDATRRAPILHIAKGLGCRVKSVFLDTPFAICAHRNSQRAPDRRVPAMTMEQMMKGLRKPTDAEGFDEVIVVEVAA